MNSEAAQVQRRPTGRERLVDAFWSVSISVMSGLAIAGSVWVAGEVSGVNDEIFRDKDCSDFTSQQQAQQALNEDDDDLHGLDPDQDGAACETLPRR